MVQHIPGDCTQHAQLNKQLCRAPFEDGGQAEGVMQHQQHSGAQDHDERTTT
jgi:hypothetical protein